MVAIGIALGAVAAAKLVSLRNAVKVLPLGILMGLGVIAMIYVMRLETAVILMTAIGAFAGFFVVPMNALLQHRGHVLMGAGHSIAVQNFNENIGVLVMLSFYAVLVFLGLSTNAVIVLFGLFVAGTMALVMWRHRINLAHGRPAAPYRRRTRETDPGSLGPVNGRGPCVRARRADPATRWVPPLRAENGAPATH